MRMFFTAKWTDCGSDHEVYGHVDSKDDFLFDVLRIAFDCGGTVEVHPDEMAAAPTHEPEPVPEPEPDEEPAEDLIESLTIEEVDAELDKAFEAFENSAQKYPAPKQGGNKVDQAKIIRLRTEDGMPPKKIAEKLGCSVQTVYNALKKVSL